MNYKKKLLAIVIAGSLAIPFLSNADTLEQLQAQINSLTAIIEALQAQLAGLPTPTPIPTPNPYPTPASCVSLSSNVKHGDDDSTTNGAVSALQNFLRATGDFSYPTISGYFGSITEQALQRFQARNSIVSYGSAETTGFGAAGPRTRALIQSQSCGGTVPPPNPYGASCYQNGVILQNGASQQFYSVPTLPAGGNCGLYMQIRQCVNGSLSGSASFTYPTCMAPSAASCTVDGVTIPSGDSRVFYSTSTVSAGTTCSSQSKTRTCTNGVLSGSTTYSKTSCSQNLTCGLDGVTVPNGSQADFYSSSTIPYNQSCSSFMQTRTCTNGVLNGTSTYSRASCASHAASSCVLDGVTVAHGASAVFFSTSTVPYNQACSTVSVSRTCTNGVLSGSTTFNQANCAVGTARSCVLDGVTVANGASKTFYLAENISASESCSQYQLSRTCTDGTLSGNAGYKYVNCNKVTNGACAVDNTVVANGATRTFYSAASAPAGKTCISISGNRTCNNGTLAGTTTLNRATCVDDASCTLDGVTVDSGVSRYFYSSRTVTYGNSCNSVRLWRSCFNGSLSGTSTYKYAACAVNPPLSLLSGSTQIAAVIEAVKSILNSIAEELLSFH